MKKIFIILLIASFGFCDINQLKLAKKHDGEAVIFYKLHRYDIAKEEYLKAIKIKEKILDKYNLELFISYNDLAWVLKDLNELKKAEKYAQKALKIANIHSDENKKATIYTLLSLIYSDLNKNKKAIMYGEKALSLKDKTLKKDDYKLGRIYANIGSMYINYDYKKAEEYLLKALKIYRKIKYANPQLASIYSNLFLIYYELNNYEKAKKYITLALEINEKSLLTNSPILAKTYMNLALFYRKSYKPKKAKLYNKKAIDILEKELSPYHINLEKTYKLAKNIYFDLKEYKKSYKYMRKAFNIHLKQRNIIFSFLDKKAKYKYIKSDKKYIFELFIFPLYIQKYTNIENENEIEKDIFNLWINYKGEVTNSQNLLLLLKDKENDKNIKDKIDKLYKKNIEYAKASLSNILNKQYNKQKIDKLLKEKVDLEESLSKKIYEFKNILNIGEIYGKDISKLLKKDELYIDYAKISDNSYAIISIDKKNNILFGVIDKKTINLLRKKNYIENKDFLHMLYNRLLIGGLNYKKIKYFLTEMDKAKKENDNKRLRTLLIKVQHLTDNSLNKYKKLIISKDGLLNKIPFGSLYNKKTKKYLIEEKEIVYVSSAKEFIRLRNRENNAKIKNNGKIVLFSNPKFDMNLTEIDKRPILAYNTRGSRALKGIKKFRKLEFGPLKGSKEEAQFITKLFPKGSVLNYAGKDATEKNLFSVTLSPNKPPKILHLVTHGFYVEDENFSNSNLKSGIALSGFNKSIRSKDKNSTEGIVTSSKLLQLDLRGTELVVFSACLTGVGDIKSAEGVEGINKAVIQAGASRVITTLWEVDDDKSAKLMNYFYQNIKAGKGYSQALRSAKIKMIREDKLSPYYWAGFILNGVD